MTRRSPNWQLREICLLFFCKMTATMQSHYSVVENRDSSNRSNNMNSGIVLELPAFVIARLRFYG